MKKVNEIGTRVIKTQSLELTRLHNMWALTLLTRSKEEIDAEPEPEYFEDDTPCPMGLYDC